MIQRLIVVCMLSALVCVAPVLSQSAKTVFDGRAAFDYVKALSADTMLGRKSGEPGGRMGAEYVAARFREWGLDAAGPGGSFFQEFPYEYYEVERGAALGLVAHNAHRQFVYGEDWRQYRYSGSGSFGAGLVFVGYGISAPGKDYDEYAGLDVKDKLVLFAVETPRRFSEYPPEETLLLNRIKAAQEHGARGVLTFRTDAQATPAFFRGGLTKNLYKPDFVVLSVESRVVDFIFKWQRADPRYFFQQIDLTGKPQSYDLGVQSLLNLKVNVDEKRPTENVLAKIAGTDDTLKNEYVIVGAHMDHLGIDMAGDVLNGADDNATGTAVVLEAARVMKLNRFAPKRTIVFALWGAEEEGLLGSKYYTEHPVYPIEKTVANINLDMEGHGTGKVGASGAYYAPETWQILKAGLPKEILDNTIPGRGGPGGSDHTHFLYNGVPAFMVSTDGPHFKTNRVGDVIDLIKPEILKNSGDFVVAALEVLSTDARVPIVPRRRETFFWRFETVVNHNALALDAVIQAHKDVQDPDVDVQLATLGEKSGLSGDALRIDVMKNLLAAKDNVGRSASLVLYGAPAAAGAPMMGPRGPSKTTVLIGLQGLAALRSDLRWADVFSRQGVAFVSLAQPGVLFGETGLSPEGRTIIEALGKANLLVIAKGLNPEQARALVAITKKPVILQTSVVPDRETLSLVKNSASTIGLVLGRAENVSAYFARLDAAKKAIGAEFVAIAADNSLWQAAGKEQMVALMAEMLKAGYSLEEMANVTSGSFMRALNRARAADPIRP